MTTYIGGVYEEVTKGGVTYYIHQLGAHTTAIVNYEYTHRDQLGSIAAITGKTLSTADIKRQSNGAWGERFQQWNGPQDNALIPQTRARGFTDHEHMDAVGLIHMNGRVYDPELGRFLSADPIIQSPYNTQSYNRYSYVFNNPLSFTDPSGFTACGGSGYSTNTSCSNVDETLIIGSREQAMAEMQRQALANANANYDYMRSFSEQQFNIQNVLQQSMIDSYVTFLVGMAVQNGGTLQWNGYSINTNASTAGTIYGGGTAVGGSGGLTGIKDFLGGLIKGGARAVGVFSLALTSGKVQAPTLERTERKHMPIYRVVNNGELTIAVATRVYPPSLSAWGEKQFWLSHDAAKKWSNALLKAGWESEVTITSTLVTADTLMRATRHNEPNVGPFVSFGPDAIPYLNAETQQSGIYVHEKFSAQ